MQAAAQKYLAAHMHVSLWLSQFLETQRQILARLSIQRQLAHTALYHT
jgi:hypothetical protein|tara:strand:+ start:760 stop:903 length:144 start_codon:yes stop_codon:yes gene_type:complete